MNILRVNVKAFTWSRESHGLFDYESRNVAKKMLSFDGDKQFVRKGQEIEIHPTSVCVPIKNIEETQILIYVRKEHSKLIITKYYSEYFRVEMPMASSKPIAKFPKLTPISPQENKEEEDCALYDPYIYRALRTSIVDGDNQRRDPYLLEEGDIIKLGRAKYKVKTIVTKSQAKFMHDEEIKSNIEARSEKNEEEEKEDIPADDINSSCCSYRCPSEYDEDNDEVKVIETYMNIKKEGTPN